MKLYIMSYKQKGKETKPAQRRRPLVETCHEQDHEGNCKILCQHGDSQQPHPANLRPSEEKFGMVTLEASGHLSLSMKKLRYIVGLPLD